MKRWGAMSSVCCSTPARDAVKAQLLQRLDAHSDKVRRLADRIRRTDRVIDQGGEAAHRRDPDQRAAERADARA